MKRHFYCVLILIFDLIVSNSAIDLFKSIRINKKMLSYDYFIETTWDNETLVGNHDPVKITMERDLSGEYLTINIRAPYFGSPARPQQNPGEFFNLWDYEVVETFFLSDSGKYLELEFGPYGHYIVLLLDGYKQVLRKGLPLEYKATLDKFYWEGVARIPLDYFPMMVTKMNAYAIHGVGLHRQYEALYPVLLKNFTAPDFHRLEYFQEIDFKKLLPNNWDREMESILWQ